jgi:hypothetical protein
MHENLNSRLKPVKHVSRDLELKGVLDDSNQTLDFVSGQFASSVFCEEWVKQEQNHVSLAYLPTSSGRQLRPSCSRCRKNDGRYP